MGVLPKTDKQALGVLIGGLDRKALKTSEYKVFTVDTNCPV